MAMLARRAQGRARSWRSGAGEGEAREPVHVAHVHPLGPRLVHGVAGEASRELLERHARLEPSERGTEAEVDALPEGDGVLDRPADVESVGVGILPLVAIRRRDEEKNALALRHSLTV